MPALALMAGPLGIRPEYRWLLPLLMLASPFYVFWSRTVMIETCALCLNCWFLAAAMHGGLIWLGVAIVVGSIGAMVKINAWATFGVAAIAYAAANVSRAQYHDLRSFVPLLFAVHLTILCGCFGLFWLRIGDAIKRRHPLSRLTQVSSLPVQREWNFGTWRFKLSPLTWGLLMSRNQAISSAGVLTCTLLCLATKQWAGLACVGLYLSAFAVFTKVHHTHDYYAAANGVFLIAALALGLSALQPALVLLGVGCVCACNATCWWNVYRPIQRANIPEPDFYAQLREACPADSVLVTLGMDWDPSIPFAIERRALMIPDWPEVTPDAVREAIAGLARDRCKVGALVMPRDVAQGITRQFVYGELVAAGLWEPTGVAKDAA